MNYKFYRNDKSNGTIELVSGKVVIKTSDPRIGGEIKRILSKDIYIPDVSIFNGVPIQSDAHHMANKDRNTHEFFDNLFRQRFEFLKIGSELYLIK